MYSIAHRSDALLDPVAVDSYHRGQRLSEEQWSASRQWDIDSGEQTVHNLATTNDVVVVAVAVAVAVAVVEYSSAVVAVEVFSVCRNHAVAVVAVDTRANTVAGTPHRLWFVARGYSYHHYQRVVDNENLLNHNLLQEVWNYRHLLLKYLQTFRIEKLLMSS